jgi:hypothetical protein
LAANGLTFDNVGHVGVFVHAEVVVGNPHDEKRPHLAGFNKRIRRRVHYPRAVGAREGRIKQVVAVVHVQHRIAHIRVIFIAVREIEIYRARAPQAHRQNGANPFEVARVAAIFIDSRLDQRDAPVFVEHKRFESGSENHTGAFCASRATNL